MQQNSRSPLLFVALTVLVASLLLVWNGMSRYQDYLSHQEQLSFRVTHAVANEMAVQIRELQQRVDLFSTEESELIARVAREPDDQALAARLKRLVQRHFPNHFAFGVTSPTGEPLIVDLDNLVGEVCLRDLARFSASDRPYAVHIHPQPGAYHFDIMARWPGGRDTRGAFFVSFPPTMVSRVLRHGELDDHRLLLLNADQRGLIEVTSRGARDTLDGPLRLSPEQLARTEHLVPVPGTRWVVANLPAPGLHGDVLGSIARETGLFIVTLILVSAVMVRFMRRAAERRFAAEASLRRAHHELELRIRDRTKRLSEANAELRTLFDEHQVSERTLREREATLRAVLDSAVDGIIVINELGIIQTFNAAAERMFGYSADEVLGRNLKMLMPEPHQHEHDTYLANYLDTGERRIIGIGRRVEGLRRDGTTFPLDLAVSEARIGRHRLYTGIVRDLSAGRLEEAGTEAPAT